MKKKSKRIVGTGRFTNNFNNNKTTKCYSFCKNDYVKRVNHGFKEYNNKQKELVFNECKNTYCSEDCLKQYITNLKLDENDKKNHFLEDYKKRLDNNFLTNIDNAYKNPKKYKQKLIEKGAISSCVSLSKKYYNPLHK
jgi:uncharacterized membrane protein YcgQ (UPF0703/DUF1980 family)